MDPRLEQINHLIGELAAGNLHARATPSGAGDAIDAIIAELNRLGEKLAAHYVAKPAAEERLNESMDVLLGIAELDFSRRARVTDQGDVFDALAAGLNMLGQELQATTVARSHLEAVLDSMGEALLVVGPDGRVRTVNFATCKLLGAIERDLVGRPITGLIADEEKQPLEESLFRGKRFERLIREGLVRNHDMMLRGAEGHPIPVSFNVQVMRSAEGKVVGLVCTARDMRDIRQLITELEDERTQLRTLNDQHVQTNQQLQVSLAELRTTQKQLIEASRKAGRADVASSVLHNVGNVLNSVNVSARMVTENLRASKSASLRRVAEVLHEHEENLPEYLASEERGSKLARYLAKLAEALGDEQATALKELVALEKNIEHIITIVGMQQAYAKTTREVENLAVAEALEAAFHVYNVTCERECVKVVRDYQALPMMMLDRHKLMQILLNLLSNAVHAIKADRKAEPTIILKTRTTLAGRFEIGVEDNGCGIAPENLGRVFNLGFTTKKDGHGFGLHSSACAAIEMGGALSCRSPGPGGGAVFTLELPNGGVAATAPTHAPMALG